MTKYIPWATPHFWGNERKYVADSLDSGWISSGKYVDQLEEKWNEVVAEAIAKDSGFKVIWDDLQAFRANYAIWNEWAYLPRPGTKRIKK